MICAGNSGIVIGVLRQLFHNVSVGLYYFYKTGQERKNFSSVEACANLVNMASTYWLKAMRGVQSGIVGTDAS